IVAQRRVTLSLLGAYAAQGNPLVNGAVVTYYGGFSDHYPAAVVDQNSMAQLRAGMNLNQRKESGDLRQQPRNKKKPVPVKPVGKPMPDQGVHSLIQQKHLQRAAGRRVPFLHGLDIQPYIFQNHRVVPFCSGFSAKSFSASARSRTG